VVEEPDPKLLKLIRERDDARREVLRLQRVAQALKLTNDRLRHQERHRTTLAAVAADDPARSSRGA
jgi:hypothetical protein